MVLFSNVIISISERNPVTGETYIISPVSTPTKTISNGHDMKNGYEKQNGMSNGYEKQNGFQNGHAHDSM